MGLLTREDILRALEALARELPAGRRAELAVVGGAALVLMYGARQSTKDVDAFVLGAEAGDAVHAAAGRVAVTLALPDDWLNDGAKGYVHGLVLGDVLFDQPTLLVRTLAIEQLLAMKLCAWRDDVDVADAALLLSKVAGQRDEVWRQVQRFLVPGRELKAQYAFDDLWEGHRGSA